MAYYKIDPAKVHYKGDKYFKFEHLQDHVIQVCCKKPDDLKGRVHAVGVYKITRQSFLSNYFRYCTVPSSKEEFESKFFDAVETLIDY